ncbi:protein Smaug homolog 2-like isoform X1 [Montipora foliosa]|uniref:protein Smaug homolog 2-like isoform X1 n=2 Tax=Montipora foliosa TaxID=591990 RepID=UPI0035F20563
MPYASMDRLVFSPNDHKTTAHVNDHYICPGLRRPSLEGLSTSSDMKPAHHTLFRDQVSTLVEWFASWNECEQTIALYTLLKRISTIQARFLSLILEHTFREDSFEVQVMQRRANDKDFLSSLLCETKDVAVKQLLMHLPLLNPRNDEARYEYLHLLPKILHHTVEHSVHQEECRQLLSLAVVHPAFPPEERNALHHWLSQLDKSLGFQERQQVTNSYISENPDVLPNTGCENLVRQNYRRRMNGWRNQALVHVDSGIGGSFEAPVMISNHLSVSVSSRKSRSNSLTPPPPMEVHDSVLEDYGEKREIEIRPGRSQSFPVDPHRLSHSLSPQSSLESEFDENGCRQRGSSFNEDARPGMKDVGSWLKNLRLHKYGSLFSQLSYEEMLGLSEEYLDNKGVTKGARNKILLSIKKLSERGEILSRLEKEVLEPGKLQGVLNGLKDIIYTPIKPFSPSPPEAPTYGSQYSTTLTTEPPPPPPNAPPHPEDLASRITRVLGKACTQILVSRGDEEHCSAYLSLVDRVLTLEAFTPTHKARLQSWKQECQKYARQRRPSHENRQRGWYNMGHNSGDSVGGVGNPPAGSGGLSKRHRGSPRNAAKNPAGQLRSSNSAEAQMHCKPRLVRAHAVVGRTKSLPIKSTQQSSVVLPQQLSADIENIDDGLESLCISVTEHALSDSTERSFDYK